MFTTCVLLTRRPVIRSSITGEVPLGGRKGKKEDVAGGLLPATLTLLPLCSLSGWADGSGGDGYPEKDSQLPGHQVAAALLKDVWIRQE